MTALHFRQLRTLTGLHFAHVVGKWLYYTLSWYKSWLEFTFKVNKPGTAKVGAISKAQIVERGTFGLCETPGGCKIGKKIKGDHWEILKKFPKKNLKMRLLNNVTMPKNVKGGPFGIKWHSLCCKIRKKSEWKNKGGPMLSMFWTSMFLLWTRFWRFEYALDVRSSSWWCWTNEQKSGQIALNWRKKTNHCKSRDFLWKRRLKTKSICVSRW